MAVIAMKETVKNDVREMLLAILSANFSNVKELGIDSILPKDQVAWKEIFQVAIITEGLGPLLYFTLQNLDVVQTLPNEIHAELLKGYHNSLAYNIFLHNKFDEVLQELSNKGIKAMVYKGVALARTVYPRLELRRVSDMDILVLETDFEVISNMLKSQGFRVADESPDDLLKAKSYKKTFVRAGMLLPISIDVHADIRYMGSSESDGTITNAQRFWGNALPWCTDAPNLFIMSPEDSILNLIAHQLFENNREPISLYCDIGFLVKQHGETINWRYVADLANSVPAGDLIVAALKRILKALYFEMPSELSDEYQEEVHSGLSSVSVDSFLRKNARLVHATLFEDFKAQRGLRNKAIFTFRYFFPSATYIKQAYRIRSHSMLVIGFFYVRRLFVIPLGAIFLACRAIAHYITVQVRHSWNKA